MEQRDLLLALGAFALFDNRRGWRLDFHRLALGALLGIDLAHFLALFAHGPHLLPLGRLLRALAEQRRNLQRQRADTVHHRQPRQAGGQGDRNQQQRDQEQIHPDRAEATEQRIADQTTEDAARPRREIRRRTDLDVQQTGGRNQKPDDPDQSQRRPQIGITVTVAVHSEQRDPGDGPENQRQQEGDIAAQVQQHIGQPRPDPPARVLQRRGHAAGVRPARIGGREGEETDQQVQQERRDHDQRDIAHQTLPERTRFGSLGHGGATGFAAAVGKLACHRVRIPEKVRLGG